jgi:hypothetical protein
VMPISNKLGSDIAAITECHDAGASNSSNAQAETSTLAPQRTRRVSF